MDKLSKKNISILIAVVIIIIIIIIYSCKENRLAFKSYFTKPEDSSSETPKEHLDNLETEIKQIEATVPEKLESAGYTEDSVAWEDVMKAEDLDESVFVGQKEYIKDVTRFSSGANFTSVSDDNTNGAFTNFIGLRRPQHVFVGNTARQQPDIDQSVLMRNKDFRFMGCDVEFKHE